MELILVVVISAGMAENSQNGVSRSLKQHMIKLRLNEHMCCKSFLKGNRNNKTFLQRLRCILWVITLNLIISYYKMRIYT